MTVTVSDLSDLDLSDFLVPHENAVGVAVSCWSRRCARGMTSTSAPPATTAPKTVSVQTSAPTGDAPSEARSNKIAKIDAFLEDCSVVFHADKLEERHHYPERFPPLLG